MALRQRTLHEVTAAGVLLAATVVVCWPWALSGQRVFVQWDALWTQLGLRHLMEALTGPAALLDAPLSLPMVHGTTMVDWMAGQAVMGAPLHHLGVPIWRVYDLLVAAGLLATAWACHRLAVALTGPGPHTWVAGVIGGLGPVQMAHAQHLNLVHHEAAVLGGLALAAGLAARRARLAGAGGFALGAGGHLGVYMGAQAALVAAVVVAACALARRGSRASWLAALGGLTLGVATIAPVAAAYLDTARRHDLWFDDERLTQEVLDPASVLAPTPTAPLHDALMPDPPPVPPLAPANPGYLALALGIAGAAGAARARRRRLGWAVVGAVGGIGVLLALGPELVWRGDPTGIPAPYRLLAELPGGRGLQAPGRHLALAACALGVVSARAVRQLAARWAHPAAPTVVSLACVAILAAETPRAHTSPTWSLGLPAGHAAIADVPGAAPWASIRGRTATCACLPRDELWATIVHGRPQAGITVSRAPVGVVRYRAAIGRWPSETSLELLRITGVEFVVEHPPLAPALPDGLDCAVMDGHRLCRLPLDRTPPVPDPRDVVEGGDGPVIGLRWPRGLDAQRLTLRCGDAWTQEVLLEPWRRFGQARTGDRVGLDVFFDEPCPAIPTGAAGDPRALVRRRR